MGNNKSPLLLNVARNLKYKTLSHLIGESLTISNREAIALEASRFAEGFIEGCHFAGPEQKYLEGQIAKYEFLDLRFDAPISELSGSTETGIPLLRSLGFVDNELADSLGEDDIFSATSCLEELRDTVAEGKTLLMLFLESSSPLGDMLTPMERLGRVLDPSKIDFPIQFTVTDACVSNSSYAWMNKHFYM